MRAPVDDQRLPVAGSITAQLAHVVALLTVDTPMRGEVVLVDKRLAAVLVLAFECSGAGVTLYMA